MEQINYDTFIENLPEFTKYNFDDDQLESFKKWIELISENFPGVGGSEKMLAYTKSLYVAHYAILHWLPANGLAPALVLGDNSSQSAGEGSINVSYSRISQSDFLLDPHMSLSNYGSQLASFIRSHSGPSIRALY